MGFLGPTWYQGDTEPLPGVVYHYTSHVRLKHILRDGVLRPHRSLPGDRVPLIWASTNPIWDAASGRPLPNGQPMGFDAQSCVGGGHTRLLIEADAFPLRWAQLKCLVDPRFLAVLTPENSQWFTANQSKWRGSTKPVTRDVWLGVQKWVAPRWVDLPYAWDR